MMKHNFSRSIAAALLTLVVTSFATTSIADSAVTGERPMMETIEVEGVVMQPAIVEVQPQYPDWLERRGIEGKVVLGYRLDKRGKAEHVQVIEASHRGFVRSALIALTQSRFVTAESNGKTTRAFNQRKEFVYSLAEKNNEDEIAAL